MADQHFIPDLIGSDETLDELLKRLRCMSRHPEERSWGPGSEHFVSARRPRPGAGAAEAPIPVDPPLAEAYAPA